MIFFVFIAVLLCAVGFSIEQERMAAERRDANCLYVVIGQLAGLQGTSDPIEACRPRCWL
jgi:hypothetical protein